MIGPGSSERKAQILLLVVVTIWAGNASFAKAGLALLDPFVFNAVRYIAAFAVLFVILRSRSEWMPVERSDYGRVLRWGFLASVLYQAIFILSLSYTSAGNVAVFLSTAPLWTALLSARMNRERIPAASIFGMVISVAGIVLLLVGSGKNVSFGGKAVLGDVLALVSAVLWALNTTLQRPLLTTYSTYQLTLMSLGIGAIGLTALAIPSAIELDWTTVAPVALVIAVVSGVFSNALANLFWSYGVKWLGPRRTSGFNNLVPVLAFIISWIAFDERILPMQVAGAGMTVFGVWWARH